jgi:hypothetical protein
MRKLITLLFLITFISCEKDPLLNHNYEFKMDGRTYKDDNGYYHLTIDPIEDQQTLHRFGAYVTKIDKWGIPTQIVWDCSTVWDIDVWGNTMYVPIINYTSYADPQIDSVYSMLAPIGSMIGDTVLIKGKAVFEEGEIILEDSFQIIFE